MIVNLRGPSGSGKSTAVKAIMAQYSDNWEPFHMLGRKQPLYYTAEHTNGRKLAVMGHYETPCGGCDTIKIADELFAEMGSLANRGYDILWEGLLLSMDFKRTHPMAQDHSTLVIGMEVDLETCLESINIRRRAKNPDAPPVPVKNTTNKWHGTRRTVQRLVEAGVHCEWHNREHTVIRALQVLTCGTI